METRVRFLELLEEDFRMVAERETARKLSPPPRRALRWKTWLGAAASLLVLAFAIGALAQVGGRKEASPASGGSFSSAGAAFGGQEPGLAPGTIHRANGGSSYGSDTVAGKGSSQGGQTDLTKIVRDGAIALAVPDGTFKDNLGRVVAIAHTNGGFVLTSQTEGAATGTMTIRVPAAHFDRAFGQVGQLGTVESSSVTGKDVTNQYLDYRAHLQNLVGRRTVLRGLLAQTTTIGESLTVYNQLAGVQEQIDQLQGELRLLNDQVEESTLTVDIREESAPAGSSETNGAIHNPSLSRAWDRAIQGFFGIIATIIVGLGYLLPVAVIAGVVYAVVRLARRRGRATS
jgi:Domain of unknown function (DUF4349)